MQRNWLLTAGSLLLAATVSAKPLVVLDAGHGGKDPGTHAGTLCEKNITLNITKQIACRLAKLPVHVRLTRSTDTFVPLPQRAAMGKKAALFISIHVNASRNHSVHGVDVFHSKGEKSALLSYYLNQALQKRLGNVRREKCACFKVLRWNSAPSTLIEIGYLTNPKEAAMIRTCHYQKLIAEAIVEGITAYLVDT